MILFIIATFFVLNSDAQHPSRAYLPQGHQNFQVSHSTSLGGIGGSGDTGNRPQQDVEKNAVTLKQEQDIGEDGSYQFGFETSNGIRAEETGNIAQAQGGFSYKGDDGYEYTITYTAGEGGFRPQGAHLPVAPPTPDAILEALKKNEQDEAAGIFDDGKYRPDQHSGGLNRPSQVGSPGHGGRPQHGGFNGY